MLSPALLSLLVFSGLAQEDAAGPAPAWLQAPRDRSAAAEWIPCDLFRNNLIFLRAKVNGVEADAVLDSGAAVTCVNTSMAAELGLEGGRPVVASGVAGSVRAEYFTGVDLEVGHVHMRGIPVVAVDFSDVERAAGRELPILLGRNLFERFVVDVDYPNRRVAFREPEGYVYSGSGASLALHDTRDGLFAVDLTVEDRKPARFLVDTGSDETIGLESDYVRRERLLAGRAPISSTVRGGAGGSHVVRIATLKSLTLAGTLLREVPARFFPEVGRGKAGVAGNLGGGILGRFRVVFDSSRGRLILEPDEEAAAAPFDKDRFGLNTVLTGGGLEVIHVCPGSPAAAAGWKEGMRIVAIDGLRVGPEYWSGEEDWKYCAAGTRVVLLDGEGNEHELVAADYY